MAAPTRPEHDREVGQRGCYVYGIVPADVKPAGDVRSVGDPPGQIELARHGHLAALVLEVDLAGMLGDTRRSAGARADPGHGRGR